MYVIDRETGKLVTANKFVDRVDWADSIDVATGRPNETAVIEQARSGEAVTYWPSAFGGKNWSPVSYSPDLGLTFINTLNIGMNYKAVEPQYRAGVFYFGAEFSFDWPEGERGYLRAIDPMTGEVKWQNGSEVPRFAGILSTAGNLVFTGKQSGEFEVFNAITGEKLYEFNVGTGVVGQPMTYEMDGRQYVSLVVGSGAVYTLFSGDERLANYPPGGALWTFALPESK